jgi:DNA sulfur modification protein DndD
VIKHYNNRFDSSSDSRIREYTRKIEKNLDRINRINDRIEKIGFEEDIAREQCSKLTNIINLHEPTMKYAQDKVRLVNKRENTAQLTKEKRNQVIKYFNTEATSYFSVKLMEDALKELKSVDKLDKGIPDIHARTIQFLIERKICLCGTKIDFGSQQYNELNRLLEFIPPHSIGYIINEFAIRCEDKSKIGTSFLENFQDKYRILRTYETERNDHQDNIIIIEDHLKNRPDIGVVQRDLNNYEKALRNLQEERGQLNSEKGGLETTNERTEADLNKLTIKDENNRKIESFKAYAHRMYDLLGKQYKEKETQTRESLSVAINDIFKKIYHGGFSLSLDEKYNIQINSDDYKEFTNSIETSTAQSISIIFAFIAGVIQMARENDNTLGNSDNGEAYPLVMDAPLSAFDKARIKTVCDTIPRIAEQVVIFIKDTDGELAEKHLEAKIGKQYYFDKKNEFETYLIER